MRSGERIRTQAMPSEEHWRGSRVLQWRGSLLSAPEASIELIAPTRSGKMRIWSARTPSGLPHQLRCATRSTDPQRPDIVKDPVPAAGAQRAS